MSEKLVKISKPKKSFETELILELGIEFLGIKELEPPIDVLFDGFIKAYGISGHSYNLSREIYEVNTLKTKTTFRKKLRGVYQKEAVTLLDKKKNLNRKIVPYDYLKNCLAEFYENPKTKQHLLDTLKYLRQMVYIATVGSFSNKDDTAAFIEWIHRYSPKYQDKPRWNAPGSVKWKSLPTYYWYTEQLSEEERSFHEIFGQFRAELIEKVALSLEVLDNDLLIEKFEFLYRRIGDIRRGKPRKKTNSVKSSRQLSFRKGFVPKSHTRKASNGEFYFAACPYCKMVFVKTCFDKMFCCKNCSICYGRERLKSSAQKPELQTHSPA